MSREIRRVPLDFAHPIGTVWPGFLSSEGGPCPGANKTCFNGMTAAGAWLESIGRFIMLVAEEGSVPPDRIAHFQKSGRIYPHPYLQEFNHPGFWDSSRRGIRHMVPPPAEMLQIVEGLIGEKMPPGPFGYDSISSWRLHKALVEKAGLGKDWGICPTCEGHADDPAKRAAAEAWEPTPPPAGPGFQVWESVSEGSPVSPVFETAVQLEHWLVGEGYSRPSAKAFIETGWVPSGIAVVDADGSVEVFKDIEGAGR